MCILSTFILVYLSFDSSDESNLNRFESFWNVKLSKKRKILYIDNEQDLKKIFVEIYEENFERLQRKNYC